MPFKNLVITLTSVIIVVAGGYLILQNRPPGDQNSNDQSFLINGTTSPSPNIDSSPSPSPTPRPKTITNPPKTTVSPTPTVTEEPEETPELTPTPTPSPVNSTLISYTNSGYVPAYVEVEVGSVVTFENDSTSSMWPASNNHPTHTLYPGSGIDKCETSPEAIFDACGPVQPGEAWSFQFDEKGTWKYHDHLYPEYGGIILVQ